MQCVRMCAYGLLAAVTAWWEGRLKNSLELVVVLVKNVLRGLAFGHYSKANFRAMKQSVVVSHIQTFLDKNIIFTCPTSDFFFMRHYSVTEREL